MSDTTGQTNSGNHDRADFIEAVKDGLRQSESGQVISSEELDKELDREFGTLRKRKRRRR
jgi:hypothetical protein